ncbi:MAG: serine--tRNA ligase, partial [Candidatus Methanomethylophilaceae archaeon]
MLDANMIRDNVESVRKSLTDRNYSLSILNDFLEADVAWRSLVDEGNHLKHLRNRVSHEITKLSGEEKQARIEEMKDVAYRIKSIDEQASALSQKRDDCLLNFPNIPHSSVPVGKDESDNIVIRHWGEPKRFDFQPKQHFEIGEGLDIIDFVRGAKVAGGGFYVLKGDGARLERA